MIRYFSCFVLVALASLSAFADDSALSMEKLDYLADTSLPGEGERDLKRSASNDLFGKKIVKVTVVNQPVGFDVLKDAKVSKGMILDAKLARGIVNSLWEIGAYSDIQIYTRRLKDGVELIIEVAPMLRVKKIDIIGNRVLGDDEVLRAIEYGIDRTIQPDPEILRQLRGKLLDVYAERGYRFAEATLRIETTSDPGGVALVIEINESEPERYVSIGLPGLPSEMNEKQTAGSAKLREGMPRNPGDVEENMNLLYKELAACGYLDAEVYPFEERRVGKRDIELTIPVAAGIKTEIDIINSYSLRKSDLRTQLFLDDTFRTSPTSLEQGALRLEAYCRSLGFYHAQVRVARKCVAQGKEPVFHTVAEPCGSEAINQKLVFDIIEGPEVEVAQVEFQGNLHFSREELEEEVFAFVGERLGKPGIVKNFSTNTLDDLGLSDKRETDLGHRGLGAPHQNRSRTYLPKLYLEVTDHLKEIYQEKGYLGVEVDDVCDTRGLNPIVFNGNTYIPFYVTRPSDEAQYLSPCVFINKERDQLIVRMNVKEGPRTKIFAIQFEGNQSFEDAALIKAFGIFVSASYNEYNIEESIRKVVNFYRENGFMFVAVGWDKTFSDDMTKAEITVSIGEGPRVTAGSIRIEGAGTTSERLIRERLKIKPGDFITPSSLEESQQSLMELGIFTSAMVQMISLEKESATKNILVQVKEGDFQYMEMRAGIATVEGVRGGFEYGYRNIAGWALNARFRARANYRLLFLGTTPVINEFERQFHKLSPIDQIERHILIGMDQPHFPGTRGLIGWGLDGTMERMNEPAFGATKYSVYLRLNSAGDLGTRYIRALTVEPRTGIEDTNLEVWAVSELNPANRNILRMPRGSTVFWVSGISVALDFRDHPLNPSKGFYLSLTSDYVRTIANVDNAEKSNFIRAYALVSQYIPFGKSGVVFAVSISGGYIFHLVKDSHTWADRYFYIGGVDTLRGFPEESLIPEDSYEELGKIIDTKCPYPGLLESPGGQAMVTVRSELRYPLAGGFLGAIFGEAGNVWRNQNKMDIFDLNPLEIHLRPVAGVGIRYATALGLFSLDLGFNLKRRRMENLIAPYFSIGSAF